MKPQEPDIVVKACWLKETKNLPIPLKSQKDKALSPIPSCLKYPSTQRPFFLSTYVHLPSTGCLFCLLIYGKNLCSSWFKGMC